jgi:hypothetical protein
MTMTRSLFALLLCLSLGRSLGATQVTVEKSKQGATAKIDGALFTEYVTRSGTKPILWPIIGPSGKPVTRPYPMEKKNAETKDHVHHRSLWFTHGNVNGIDFWAEEPAGKSGTIVHRKFVKIDDGVAAENKDAEIETEDDWMGPSGKKVCEDVRRLGFGASAEARWIDFDISIRASEGPLTFGDTKEGSFGLRVADSMRVDAKGGGKIISSVGQTDADAWGKHANWVDYHGPLDGQTVGIAIFDHPSNLRHPTGWHVRTYGLFAANPFAAKGFDSQLKANPYTLPKGETLHLKYRVYLHLGDEKQGHVAEAYGDYAGSVKKP